MIKVIFTNSRGESITFADDYNVPYRFLSIDGLGGLEASTQMQSAPYQDGSTYIASILSNRLLPVRFVLLEHDTQELARMRRYVSRVFNPKLGLGTLRYEYEDGAKEIMCVPEASPYFPIGNSNQTPFLQKGLVDLIAPNPYWKDPQEVSRALRAYEGKFKLPTTFPIEFGISGDKTILYNEGDVETPITIDIQGPVTNPRVINKTTGEYIRVNLSLSANDVLHIDTNDQNKRVEIYRDGLAIEKAIGYLDHNSDFWKLDVGYNEIQYIADAGDGNAIVAIAWHDQFVGI